MRSPHARHGGRNLELYAAFSRSGATCTPFPDPHSHRIRPEDLRDAAVRRLHLGAQLALIHHGERGVIVETVSA